MHLRKMCGAMLGVLVLAGGGTALQAGDNGAFDVVWSAPIFGKQVGVNLIVVDCNPGFTCGLANAEVDWDDGSAIDSFVGYIPFSEVEFDHEYASNGLYHADISIDDDQNNWWQRTRDFDINAL